MTVCEWVEKDEMVSWFVVCKLERENKRQKWSKVFRDWVLKNGKEGEQYVMVDLVAGPVKIVKQLKFEVEEVD